MKKRVFSGILTLAIIISLCAPALAKTDEAARAENIFFYATNREGKAVLLKVAPLGEIKALSHGAPGGGNYYISSTDNYPTTQYTEARGVTVPELVEYFKTASSVDGAGKIGFSGADTLRLMATDSFGNYNRSWTYNELYGAPRYYFEGLFNAQTGWKPGWEIVGEDSAKFGMTLDEYNEKYKDSDPYYAEKRAVFGTGVRTEPVLATESYSGRTTSSSLTSSTEPGIAEKIAENGGVAADSLKNMLIDETALRFSLPMTEADLMTAHRTAYDNFKWIYNLRLDMASAPDIKSLGTVAEPAVSVSLSGDTLTLTMSCETPGATIYYSFDGAPQTPYTKAVVVDVKGRNLASNPVTFYMTAVREGYDDAGVITAKYPGLAPAFKTLYSGMAGQNAVLSATSTVSVSDWSVWTGAMQFITLKAPGTEGYVRISDDKIKVDNAKKELSVDGSLLTETGSYSFIFHAAGYADKTVALTIKKPAPLVEAPKTAKTGMPLTFKFADEKFQEGLTVYVTPPGGESVIIPSSWLDRTASGRVTLKAAYFDSPGCAISAPGDYAFSFVNSGYEPGSVGLTLNISASDIPAFEDLKAENWYYDAVRYVLGAGIVDASTETSFGAGAPMTRLMLAEALYRLDGSPAVDSYSPFTDASAPSVTWAYEAGVINGVGGGRFAPDGEITREQIAAMFFRYANYKNKAFGVAGDLLVFTDTAQISSWAVEALTWAVGEKIINGMGDGRVAPQGTATRAQVSQILFNYQ